MRRHYLMIAALMLTGIFPLLALAEMTGPPPDFVAEHPAAFSWVLGVALVALCSMLGLKLMADAKNNERQWQFISKNADDVTDIKIDVARLRAVCDSRDHIQLKKRGDG